MTAINGYALHPESLARFCAKFISSVHVYPTNGCDFEVKSHFSIKIAIAITIAITITIAINSRRRLCLHVRRVLALHHV